MSTNFRNVACAALVLLAWFRFSLPPQPLYNPQHLGPSLFGQVGPSVDDGL